MKYPGHLGHLESEDEEEPPLTHTQTCNLKIEAQGGLWVWWVGEATQGKERAVSLPDELPEVGTIQAEIR